MARSFRPEAVTFGLLLITIGVLWTLGNLGRLDLLATLRTWWPLALVVWGTLELLSSYATRERERAGRPE